MGCGGSKLEGDDDTAPPGLRPFRRRIDEIRQRRSGRTLTKDPSALSSKQLLQDENEEGHHQDQTTDAPSYCEIRKSVSSPPPEKENVASTNKDATTEKEQNNNDHHYHPMSPPESEMRMSVSSPPEATTEVPLHCRTSTPENEQKSDDNNKKNNNVESDRPDVAVVSQGKEGEDQGQEGKRQEDDNSGSGDEKERDEEGDGREIGPGSPSFSGEGGYLYEDGRDIGPGSPSFRDYFLSSANNAAESDSSDTGNREDTSSRVETKEDKPSRRKNSSSSNEGSMDKADKAVKKESKGRMFKNVLPKGRHGAKNLWNVRSCYHPSATSSVPGKDGKIDAQ